MEPKFWPEKLKDLSAKDKELIDEMQKARFVTEMSHAIRKEKGIPVRQPLAELRVSNFQFSKKVADVVADEVNVKKIISKAGKGDIKCDLDTKISKELEEEAMIRDLVRKIQAERKALGLNLTQKVTVQIETLPTSKELTQWMLKKAQISSLSKGKFKVSKSS